MSHLTVIYPSDISNGVNIINDFLNLIVEKVESQEVTIILQNEGRILSCLYKVHIQVYVFHTF